MVANPGEGLSDSNEQLRTALLEDVRLHPDIDSSAITYDPLFGGLVLPTEDGQSHLIMFRSHPPIPTERHTLADASPPIEQKATHHRTFGTGYYLGNSPAAVELFAWTHPDNEIGVYMTPPLDHDAMVDFRSRADTVAACARQLTAVVYKSWREGSKGEKRIAAIDQKYGDSDVAVMDMGPDSFMAHRVIAPEPHHLAPPVWFLWRADPESVERIGAAPVRNWHNPVFGRLYRKAFENREQKR